MMKQPFLYSLILFFFLTISSGCLNAVTELYPENEQERPIPIYIVSHGWHAGIAIESVHIKEFLPDHSQMPEAEILKFGWGDGRYYTDPDAGFGLLLRAAFLPTRSVLHVVGVDIPLESYFSGSDIVKIQITGEGAEQFAQFVDNRMKRDSEGMVVFAEDGLYRNSAFFEATGRYYLPKTSNIWTARALRQTGYPITPIYSFTSGNVVRQAKKEGEIVQ